MQFRGFVFPSNPKSIQIQKDQRIVAHFCPGKGDMLQPLGASADSITCVGWFWGQTSEETAQQIEHFLEETKGKQAGLLFLPYGTPIYAYLQHFATENVGDGKAIPYRMVFTRDSEYGY